MPSEIERKFLLAKPPEDLLRDKKPDSIRQGYLILEQGRELRVRQKGDRCFIASKQGHGMVREENEQEIDADLFNLLWPFTESRRLQKQRFIVNRSQYTYEIDVYEGKLAGLVVMEVEFDSVESANTFTMPEFCQREITDDWHYKNAVLAEKGQP